MFTRESIDTELKRIQANAPELLKKNVIREQLVAPEVVMVVEKALEDPDFPEEKKIELRKLKENGHFDRKEYVEDPKIAKQLDNYMAREIKKSIKEGRLPSRKQLQALGLNKLHD